MLSDKTIPATPHFHMREFASRDTPVPDYLWRELHHLMLCLENLRQALGGRPIHINSGYRTPEHNREVGGTPGSMHQYGVAADISCHQNPHFVWSEIESLIRQGLMREGGLGLYAGHVHYDTRGYKARWEG